MVIGTFFDLQRFADTLVSGDEGFSWQGGGSFAGTNSAPEAATVGTANNVARLVDSTVTGALSTAGTADGIYLNGSTVTGATTFNVDDNDWSVTLNNARDIVHVSATNGLDSVTGGEAVLGINAGRRNAFAQTINGTEVYIQAGSSTTATVSADGSAVTYEIAAADGIIGLAANDTAVLTAANAVEIKPQADTSVDGVKNITAANATVTSDGSTSVDIAVKDAVTVGSAAWAFANKSARDAATVTATADDGITKVEGYTDSATLTAKGLENVEVNGVAWGEISGKLTNVVFDKDGYATINNTGSVTVEGSGIFEKATFATVTSDGVVANTATIEANAANVTAVLGASAAGVAELAVSDSVLAATVSGDELFFVTVNEGTANKKSYEIATDADEVVFTANAVNADVIVEAGKAYSLEGGDGLYAFADNVAAKGSAQVSINGAAVTVTNNNSSKNYLIASEKGNDGIAGILALEAGDAISVSGDDDGYEAVFDASDASGVVTFTANGKTVSVNAGDIESSFVTLAVDGKNNVLVQGIDDDAIVTVSGNATYYFNDKKAGNRVKVVSSDDANVTINGGVVDYRESNTQPAIDEDDSKWNEIATIGGSSLNGGTEDTVTTNRSSVYNDFYDLAEGNAADFSVAGYDSDDDEEPATTKTAIVIEGNALLDEATHVTLTVGAGGDSVGKAPLNIQANENDSVVAVKIDLTNSDNPSTVAIGTTGTVTASHEVSLSNQTGGYGYIGEGATGENKLFGGSGADMLRHDGSKQATLVGGAGNDTIRGDAYDIVRGGDGADYFYDTAGYALDYEVSEGDIIIASRVKEFGEITAANVRGTGNAIGFGDGKQLLTLSNINPNDAVHVKVALMDDDGNVLDETKDIVLANGNGEVTVDSSASVNGALIFAGSDRGNGVHSVIGSAGKDSIYVGSNDFVNGAGGNDYIVIDSGAENVSVSLGTGTGLDTVSGWNFGFDSGKTVLETGDVQVRARVYEDMLHISLQGASESGDAILFEDTQKFGDNHGQYDVLVGSKKYTAIRNNGEETGYASVTSNDGVADYYSAERNGIIHFTEGVTTTIGENGVISLNSDNFWAIREIELGNNSKTSVIGSSDRETVTVGGAASVGANKTVSLAGGNDVIISSGDDSVSAGHKFYFGAGDGRDTIEGYSHYLGVDVDPDKQLVDTIVLQGYTGLKVDSYEDGDRIEIGTTSTDRVVIYEEDGVNVDNVYQIQVGFNSEAELAKIGSSEGGNNFTYDKKVTFYVGASGDAHDTLTITDASGNVDVRLDGYGGGFYRGIDVVDASSATSTDTYTNISIGGSADNNTIIAGGAGTTNFLWGGAGDNSLIGGEGIDYFLYYYGSDNYVQGGSGNAATKGNNDTIANYDETKDFIFLNDVTFDQIDVAAMMNLENNGITTEDVTVKFKNGGSLTVNVSEQERVAFYMQNGEGGYDVYSAERSTGAWHKNP